MRGSLLKDEQGAILAMLPFVLAVLLLITGFVLFVNINRLSHNDLRQAVRLSALAAVKAMQDLECSDPNDLRGCNQEKVTAATEQIAAFFLDNENSPLFEFQLACAPDYLALPRCNFARCARRKNCVEFTPGKYIERMPVPQPDGFTEEDYPLFQPVRRVQVRGDGFISNAAWLRTEVQQEENPFAFKTIFFGDQQVDRIPIEEMARSASRAIFFLADKSPSVALATHKNLPYIFDSYYRPNGAPPADPLSNDWLEPLGPSPGDPVTQPAALAAIGSGDPRPDIFQVQPSYFAFSSTTDCAGFPTEAADEREQHWAHMYPTRAEIPASVDQLPYIHAQEDYYCVKHYAPSIDAYTDYSNSHFHPDPSVNTFILNSLYTDAEEFSLVDLYRNPNPSSGGVQNRYVGPEPFTSILAGLEEAFWWFEETGGYFDKAGMILPGGTSNGSPWTSATILTGNFEYLRRLADVSGMRDPSGFRPSSPGPIIDATTGNNIPLWLRLGAFPKPTDNTPVTSMVRYAAEQLQSDPEVAEADKAIVLFTDGEPNCALQPAVDPLNPTPPGGALLGCDDSVDLFKDAVQELNWIVDHELVNAGIKLHIMLIGPAAGVPYNGEETTFDQSVGRDRCATDSEYRERDANYVLRRSPLSNLTQTEFDSRHRTHQSPVAHEFWLAAAKTGGVFRSHVFPITNRNESLYLNPSAPVRSLSIENCAGGSSDLELACPINERDAAWGDQRDRDCTLIDEKISRFVRDIFQDSSRFQLVPIANIGNPFNGPQNPQLEIIEEGGTTFFTP